MGDIVAKEVQIKVKLDISDAQRKGRILKAIGRSPGAGASAPGSTAKPQAPAAGVPSTIARAVEKSPEPIVKALERAGGAAAGPIARVAGVASAGAGIFGMGEGASAGLKVAGKAVAAYGLARLGIKAGLAYGGILQGAAGGEGESAIADKLSSLFNSLEAKVTALESRVVAAFEAGMRAKEIAMATAQISGQVPNVARIYSQQFQFAAQERDLEKAFERFKYNQTNRAIGNEIGQAVRASMGR